MCGERTAELANPFANRPGVIVELNGSWRKRLRIRHLLPKPLHSGTGTNCPRIGLLGDAKQCKRANTVRRQNIAMATLPGGNAGGSRWHYAKCMLFAPVTNLRTQVPLSKQFTSYGGGSQTLVGQIIYHFGANIRLATRHHYVRIEVSRRKYTRAAGRLKFWHLTFKWPGFSCTL